MIIHSIIPCEYIFKSVETCNENESKTIEISYLGEKVQVSQLSNSSYKINRLISTSPKAYLNPQLQPGTIIEGRII